MKKLSIIGPLILIALWMFLSFTNLIDSFFLPSPFETFYEIFVLLFTGKIIPDLFTTFIRTIEAFLIALVLGVPLGLFLGGKEKVYRSLEFLIDFFRSTPITAIFPLFLLLFGIGDLSKIAVASFAALLLIIFNTAYGVLNANKSRILAAKVMGASKWQVFKKVVFFESLPETFIGLRTAISWTLVVIVVTEMFIGTNIGIGHYILNAQYIYDIKGMYASIILAGLLGYLLNYTLLFLERKYIHWKGK